MRTQNPPLYRKIGGLHFIRVGRVQFSFCLCRPKATPREAAAPTIDMVFDQLRATWLVEDGIRDIVQALPRT